MRNEVSWDTLTGLHQHKVVKVVSGSSAIPHLHQTDLQTSVVQAAVLARHNTFIGSTRNCSLLISK